MDSGFEGSSFKPKEALDAQLEEGRRAAAVHRNFRPDLVESKVTPSQTQTGAELIVGPANHDPQKSLTWTPKK